mmetsp:Transcript_33029/g.85025  ORF Transcript_33029/g.85025 Transcript_33029/m.85025 type:complete len:403 (+) Transcript_33029:56-1264(+)
MAECDIVGFGHKWLQYYDAIYGGEREQDFECDWYDDINDVQGLCKSLMSVKRQYMQGDELVRRHGGIGGGKLGGAITFFAKVTETVTASGPDILPYQHEMILRLGFRDGRTRYFVASIGDLLFLLDGSTASARHDLERPLITNSVQGFRKLAVHLGAQSKREMRSIEEARCTAYSRDADASSDQLPKGLGPLRTTSELWAEIADLMALLPSLTSAAAKEAMLDATRALSMAAEAAVEERAAADAAAVVEAGWAAEAAVAAAQEAQVEAAVGNLRRELQAGSNACFSQLLGDFFERHKGWAHKMSIVVAKRPGKGKQAPTKAAQDEFHCEMAQRARELESQISKEIAPAEIERLAMAMQVASVALGAWEQYDSEKGLSFPARSKLQDNGRVLFDAFRWTKRLS